MSTTRRALAGAAVFGAAFAATAIGLAPPAEAENPDATLLAACRELHAAMDQQAAMDARPGWPDAALEAASDRWHAALAAVVDLPPQTPDGLRMKAAVTARVLRRELRVLLDLTIEEQAEPYELLALALAEEAARVAA